MKYNKDDYKFTETMVIYKGEYLGRADLVKHLNEWWPGVNWKRWSTSHYYKDLKLCLESRIKNAMTQNYHIEDYSFTPARVFYQGKYLSTFELAMHLSYWCPGVIWAEWATNSFYFELKKCLESKIHKI